MFIAITDFFIYIIGWRKYMEKSFLKWAGSKYRMLDDLIPLINSFRKTNLKDQMFIEPFLGSGSVFLNVNTYDNFILNDLNVDLYMIFNQIKNNPEEYIKDLKELFNENNNQVAVFKDFVKKFNATNDYYERAKIFIYLNRHCFNGLMRFNQSGKYNTPFGRYSKPYLPEKEILKMNEKLNKNKVQLFNHSFERIFENLEYGDVVYCDPPYIESFTQYNADSFNYDKQKLLADLALTASLKGSTVIISNHYNEVTQELYKNCSEYYIKEVRRSISAKSENRGTVKEIIAVFA